jgi:HD-GYP domain-containing protein (c-di-GMP phosphodiesterase class II)
LPWNVYGNNAHLLLNRGYIIESEQQLTALLERGMYIEASELEQTATEKPQTVKNYDAFRFWDDMSAKLGVTLARPSIEQDFSARIASIGSQVQYIVQRSADTVIAIIMLTMDHRRYPIVHSLQVAVFCEMVANRLGWDKTRRMDLLCAALTMNISMLEVQQQLANQSGPLAPEQEHFIKRHPTESVAMLRNAGVTSPGWLLAVEEHHETASGTGYPRGIKDLTDEAALL